MQYKKCTECQKSLSNEQFHKHKGGKYGTASKCKTCFNKYKNSRYDKCQRREWCEKHREAGDIVYWNIRASKLNARVRSRYGEIKPVTGGQLKGLYDESPQCHYCGALLHHTNCHVDHKWSSVKGGIHEIKNLVISCKRCNLTKNGKTDGEFFVYIERIYKKFFERRQSAAKAYDNTVSNVQRLNVHHKRLVMETGSILNGG